MSENHNRRAIRGAHQHGCERGYRLGQKRYRGWSSIRVRLGGIARDTDLMVYREANVGAMCRSPVAVVTAVIVQTCSKDRTDVQCRQHGRVVWCP